jgi:hypothetical protein
LLTCFRRRICPPLRTRSGRFGGDRPPAGPRAGYDIFLPGRCGPRTDEGGHPRPPKPSPF